MAQYENLSLIDSIPLNQLNYTSKKFKLPRHTIAPSSFSDHKHLFSAYDKYRISKMAANKNLSPMKHRIVDEITLNQIKS